MTKRTSEFIKFPGVKGRQFEAQFSSQGITSDGGGGLLRSADKTINLLPRIAKDFIDNRCKSRCNHSMETLLKQRVYALALGYEDLNDHNELRKDPALNSEN